MEDFLKELQKARSGFLERMRLLFIIDLIAYASILYAIFIIINIEYFLNKSSIPAYINIKQLPLIFALVIAVITSLLMHKKDKKINVMKLIEKNYPDLNEKLSTAYDNRTEKNIIVDSLKNAVSELMKFVSPSKLITKNRIILKIFLTISIIAGMVFISFNPQEYQIPEETLANVTKAISGEGDNNSQIDVTGLTQSSENIGQKGSGDIIGKPQIAPIEGKNIDLSLTSGTDTGFDVKETGQTTNQFIKSAAFPVDAIGSNVSDGSYSMLMKKTETEKELINKYAVERSKI